MTFGSSVVAKPCLLIVTEYSPGVSCGALKPLFVRGQVPCTVGLEVLDFDVRAGHDSAVRVLRGSSNCSGCNLTWALAVSAINKVRTETQDRVLKPGDATKNRGRCRVSLLLMRVVVTVNEYHRSKGLSASISVN